MYGALHGAIRAFGDADDAKALAESIAGISVEQFWNFGWLAATSLGVFYLARLVLDTATDDISERVVKSRTFRLIDVLDQTTPPAVIGRTFVDCVIHGPAVVVVRGGLISGVSFDTGDPDAVFWGTNAPRITGAVELRDCIIRGGEMRGIGFTGSEREIDAIRTMARGGMVPSPPHSPSGYAGHVGQRIEDNPDADRPA